jgi:hypothetical protein
MSPRLFRRIGMREFQKPTTLTLQPKLAEEITLA